MTNSSSRAAAAAAFFFSLHDEPLAKRLAKYITRTWHVVVITAAAAAQQQHGWQRQQPVSYTYCCIDYYSHLYETRAGRNAVVGKKILNRPYMTTTAEQDTAANNPRPSILCPAGSEHNTRT